MWLRVSGWDATGGDIVYGGKGKRGKVKYKLGIEGLNLNKQKDFLMTFCKADGLKVINN